MIVEDTLDLTQEARQQAEDLKRLQSIQQAPSESLCGIVVGARALGIMQDFAKVCMAELMRRRELGEDFAFEEYIEDKVKTIPLPKSKLTEIKSFL